MNLAILSTSCRFPDASSPAELWTNIVEGRRSFRAMPAERINLARYAADQIGEADSISQIRAALLINWSFDRGKFRIPGKTFVATDLTHWLALELAAEAIDGIGGLDRLDRERTAVVVANTMTGEFSRAALLRLRLPFLEDVLSEASEAEGLSGETTRAVRQRFAAGMRRHFADPNEESLAGGLANTIAGRIANYFDFGGGAYSVDAACASSLVALADAANLLTLRQADAIVVAAVDLSLDPFELVGFSRNGALAADEMRVFDARAGGFWPGEGGACAVLMRENDALRRGLPMLAKIRGWGLSTDGAGGLTRPSSEGQLSAYRRAYEMGQVEPGDVAFVEAHGTGTAVGDPIEVRALAALRDSAHAPLPIGSIKANIGHTKAAAGFAGLIKAIEALRHGIVPPHVGCTTPHPVFAEVDGRVRLALAPKAIADTQPAIAGISSFGFGGINAHFVIERAGPTLPSVALPRPPIAQEIELFLFSGGNVHEVIAAVTQLERRAATLSMAELADAAAHCAAMQRYGPVRLAVLASNGAELAERLSAAKLAIASGNHAGQTDLFIGRPEGTPRIGFLFPGQGAPCRPQGGVWRRRFAEAADLIAQMPATNGDLAATNVAQPIIVASSLAALRVLERLGVTADIAAGHSLGEISALAWAGALEPSAAGELARARGAIMAKHGLAGGAMLRVTLSANDAEQLLSDCGVVVACRNGRFETVVAGSPTDIDRAAARCAAHQIDTSRLAVSHAFHSPHMVGAAIPLATALVDVHINPVAAPVVSTVTGASLLPGANLKQLLVDQLSKPVIFDTALEEMAAKSDILIEVGPGHGLTRLARERDITAMSVDALGESLKPLLATLGSLFVAGVDIRANELFNDRAIRCFDPADVPRFIENPCGTRNTSKPIESPITAPLAVEDTALAMPPDGEPLSVVLATVAKETGLNLSLIGPDDRFLDTLHLNSLAVARIVRTAARALNVRIPSLPTEFANATPHVLASALSELREFGDAAAGQQRIAGVRPWVRTYGMIWQAATELNRNTDPNRWSEVTIEPDAHQSTEHRFSRSSLIWIDGQFRMPQAERLVDLVAAAIRAGVENLAICHNALPISAFARSVAYERYFRSLRVIDRGAAGRSDIRIEKMLSAQVERYHEVRLVGQTGFETPGLSPSAPDSLPSMAITANDIVVVVGGGKGIAAECALRIAQRGSVVIMVGRSAADDPEVAATLDRAKQKRLPCHYVSADLMHPAEFAERLKSSVRKFGPVTVLLYAAGVNEPRRLTEIDEQSLKSTLALKTTALESVLLALGPQLRRLVTFGSIIGRIGLEGETLYALANAMQTAATEAWARAAAHRTALAIEWSLWGGIGMGERLGTIERLGAIGVDAISVNDALEEFDKLLLENAIGSTIVTSRFGKPRNLSLGPAELPMMRFVDEPRLHFPGVELIVETTLSLGRDPYLADHAIDGHTVFPGVVALEAMSQVANALRPLEPRIVMRSVAFTRAVYVAEHANMKIRIAALHGRDSTTEVELFAEDDEFAVACMRATFCSAAIERTEIDLSPLGQAFPAAPLYGPLFFGRHRFERLDCFELATSREISARLRQGRARWFGQYEPDTLVLWDPGIADASLHAVQIAVPHRRVLPVAAERIEVDQNAGIAVNVRAKEKKSFADSYVFDIVATDANGCVAWQWTNAAFRVVGGIHMSPVLTAAPPLARPYLERIARESLEDDSIEIALIHGESSRELRRTSALHSFGRKGLIERRGDGCPIRRDGLGFVSLAHGAVITLAVTANCPIACDIEPTDGAEADDLEEIQRHLALEVCRKLGRRPDSTAISAIKPNVVAAIGDVELITVDLLTTSGIYAVAVGRLRRTTTSILQIPSRLVREATA
ncbi:type I polyketide synthase [Bradyrhizobium sp. AUGA SZCCT0431]|uniref:type I polyketide synthase n=1 Tax=Bradyrhizobium sp. AUGA SZCCT0431 TaxID=2807674 RepID=UPI001BAC3981|nr:type I polyketide synthase [Bradyrhizobium sp. AUGA SZCCT0431]MBR1147548.1 SDR family NAD(P)-dependent oxidoreductase [Bradyrhizobium sp. AUGA SZCCT0431]